MSKNVLIQCICQMDPDAKPEVLVNYSEEELRDYLEYWETLLEARELVSVSEG